MKSAGTLLQYACFNCRKSFKRPQFSESRNRFMTSDQLRGQSEDARKFEKGRSYKCPDCGGMAHFMGQDFKAPKRSDARAWQNAQAFIEAGEVFYRGTE